MTPRLFICWKKSYLHSLIRYPTIINFEDFPPKMVIFHKKWLNFEKNPTSIILLHTPCLFHILHLSDSTLIQYPTSIWYPRVKCKWQKTLKFNFYTVHYTVHTVEITEIYSYRKLFRQIITYLVISLVSFTKFLSKKRE